MSVNIGGVSSDAMVSIVVMVLPVCIGIGIRVGMPLTMTVVGGLRMSIHIPMLMVVGVVS